IHVTSNRTERFAAVLRISMLERGIRFKGLHDGPCNEVCKAELATAFECALPVDKVPVFFDHSNRYLALRSCNRNRQTRSHVLRNAGSGAAQRNQLLAHAKRLYFLPGNSCFRPSSLLRLRRWPRWLLARAFLGRRFLHGRFWRARRSSCYVR